jgi:uncharacterized protein with GYD domain
LPRSLPEVWDGLGGSADLQVVVQYAALLLGARVRLGAPSGLQGADLRKEPTMPMYLTRFSYTPETWARLAKNPEDRRDAARTYIEAVGGKLHGFWYAFGEFDGYNLWEAPDNVAMSAVAIALGGGGAISKLETTVLQTVEETLDALSRVERIQYRPPGE